MPISRQDDAVLAHESKAIREPFQQRFVGIEQLLSMVNRVEDPDQRKKRQRVQEETPEAAPRRQRHSRQQRPDDAREIELQRVHRHRVRQTRSVFEQIDDHRLPCRRRERLRDADDERSDDDLPDGDAMEIDRERQQERGERLRDLRDRHDALPVDLIGEHAAGQHEHDRRRRAREADEAEKERRVGEPIDEPALRDRLHPRADVRDELRGPEAAVVGFLESFERHPV